MDKKTKDGALQDRRPFLNPHVFDEVRACVMCDRTEKMFFWRNVKMKPEYQFEFLVCKICGHTIILESFVRFNKESKIDLARPDVIGLLHDLTKGSRAAATNFIKPDSVEKAISVQNLRYITIDEEKKIISVADEKYARLRMEADIKRRASEQNMNITVTTDVVRANGVNFKLAVTRAKREEERKMNDKPMQFECKYCVKKFSTKAKLNNHRCKSDDKETYIEKAMRLNEARATIKNGNGANPQ